MTGLRLRIHPVKSQLFETRHGANFVGFRVMPDRIRVRNDNLRRARKRCRQLQQDYAVGAVSLEEVIQRLRCWEAHLKHGDTWRLRRKFFDDFVFRRDSSDIVNTTLNSPEEFDLSQQHPDNDKNKSV